MTDFRSNAFVDVDFSDLEKRVTARHTELVRTRGNPCAGTHTARLSGKRPEPVDLPPRHPATNIGE